LNAIHTANFRARGITARQDDGRVRFGSERLKWIRRRSLCLEHDDTQSHARQIEFSTWDLTEVAGASTYVELEPNPWLTAEMSWVRRTNEDKPSVG
jgi:hypothetical protein